MPNIDLEMVSAWKKLSGIQPPNDKLDGLVWQPSIDPGAQRRPCGCRGAGMFLRFCDSENLGFCDIIEIWWNM